jgi:phosphoribosylaminoimidazolecarboxamide formyltransferase/IMP cyclohydrolase
LIPTFWKDRNLAYGENPHQRAAYYAEAGARRHPALARRAAAGQGAVVQQPQRPLAARQLVEEFTLPACVIVKHANPCGVAVAGAIEAAYARALGSDPVSAYGGVVVLNRPVDARLGAAGSPSSSSRCCSRPGTRTAPWRR